MEKTRWGIWCDDCIYWWDHKRTDRSSTQPEITLWNTAITPAIYPTYTGFLCRSTSFFSSWASLRGKSDHRIAACFIKKSLLITRKILSRYILLPSISVWMVHSKTPLSTKMLTKHHSMISTSIQRLLRKTHSPSLKRTMRNMHLWDDRDSPDCMDWCTRKATNLCWWRPHWPHSPDH